MGRPGEPAQNLLRLAATIGRQFDVPLLQTAAGQEADAVEEGLRDWLARRLVKPYSALDAQYDFSHDKIRAAVYQAAGPARRQALHRHVAEALEYLHAEYIEEHAGPLVHHWGQAKDTERERRYSRMAGEQAAAVFANAEAVTYLSRALDLTPKDSLTERYDLLLAREKLYNLQGERQAQMQDLVALQELAERLADARRQAEVALLQTHYTEVAGDCPAAIAAAQKAVRLAQAVQDVHQTPTA